MKEYPEKGLSTCEEEEAVSVPWKRAGELQSAARCALWIAAVVLAVCVPALRNCAGKLFQGVPWLVPAVLISAAVVLLLSFIPPALATRLIAWVMPLGLLFCVVWNLCEFRSIDKSGRWRLRRHSSNRLSHLAQKSPQPWASTLLHMYLSIYENFEGRTVVAYEDGILYTDYLRNVARVKEFRIEQYSHELTSGEVKRLLGMRHLLLRDNQDREFVLVLEKPGRIAEDPLYLMATAERYFLIPEQLLRGEDRAVTEQVLFLATLHVTGVLAAALLKKRLPFSFICFSGFLWGALAWCLTSLLILIARIPYTAPVCAVAMGCVLAALIVANIKVNGCVFTRSEVKLFCASTFLLAAVAVLAATFNHAVASYDSYKLISFGRSLAQDAGFSADTTNLLASWGIFAPLFHSAAIFLKLDYLYAIHPVFAYVFLVSFYCLLRHAGQRLFPNGWIARGLPLLGTLAMASTYFLVFQAFYIHNNLLSGIYLFIGVSTAWLSMQEKNPGWLFPSWFAMLGFVLLRMEAPLIAGLFLSLFVFSKQVTYRIRLAYVLPYIALVLLWYVCLLAMIISGADILTPSRALAMMSLLAALALFVIFSRYRWVERLMRFLPLLIPAGLLIILWGACALAPRSMAVSLTAVLQNMTATGGWGATWWVLLLLLVLARFQPRLSHQELFSVGIPSFLMVLAALAYFRADIPYRQGWGDSANRILTHIVPLAFFYLTLRYGAGLFSVRPPIAEPPRRLLHTLLAAWRRRTTAPSERRDQR